MDMANFFFPMVVITLATLKMTKLKDKVDFTIQMETTIKDNLRMTLPMDMDNIFQPLEENIKEPGKMIKGTVKVSRHGQMEQFFRAGSKKIRKMEKENSSTSMGIPIQVR
jgi:hypothetical protein